MATSAEALAFLRSKFKIASEEGDLLSMWWTVDNDRSQLVFVETRETLMIVSSPIAEVSDVSAAKVLEESDSVFGITNTANAYMLTHVVFLENADANEIEEPLELLAAHADTIQQKLGIADKY